MIVFKIIDTNGIASEYKLPQTFKEITLERYIDFCKAQREIFGATLCEAMDSKDGNIYRTFVELEDSERTKIEQRLLGFWAGVPESMYIHLTSKEMTALANVMLNYSLPVELKPNPELPETIEHEGVTYKVASYDLADLTMGEVAEIQRAQRAANEAINGIDGLPAVMATVLRIDENDIISEQVMERKRKAMLTLPMDKVFDIAFFLGMSYQKYLPYFHTYLKMTARSQLTKLLSH